MTGVSVASQRRVAWFLGEIRLADRWDRFVRRVPGTSSVDGVFVDPEHGPCPVVA